MEPKPRKSKHPLYNTWKGMHYRCYNPSFRQWKDYGGRGISVCERWFDFNTFAEDMGVKPPGYSIDRIDNNGNYGPTNCRWATKKEQQRNQRVVRKIIVEGQSYVAADIAEKYGFKTDTIVKRAESNLSMKDLCSRKKRVFYDGLKLGGKANGAKKQAMTHCKHGHEFTPENTSITKHGWRRCRRCHADSENRRRANRS